MVDREDFPSLSVIVATYNSASKSFLAECLQSIARQRYPGAIELLVADGGSTDQTLAISESFGAKIVRNPSVTELGYQGGKNRALKAAQGAMISFVDADNILIESDFFLKMVRPFILEPNVVMSVPCPHIPARREMSEVGRYFCLAERDYWVGLSSTGQQQSHDWVQFRPQKAVVPNAALLRRSVLESIGGWDYDTEVAARLLTTKWATFAYVPEARRLHREVKNYREVLIKLNRRTVHQTTHASEKPVVSHEIAEALRDPVRYVRDELSVPLFHLLTERNLTYIQALPVFGIKVGIQVVRRTWKVGR